MSGAAILGNENLYTSCKKKEIVSVIITINNGRALWLDKDSI